MGELIDLSLFFLSQQEFNAELRAIDDDLGTQWCLAGDVKILQFKYQRDV